MAGNLAQGKPKLPSVASAQQRFFCAPGTSTVRLARNWRDKQVVLPQKHAKKAVKRRLEESARNLLFYVAGG
jgi:hypothetical protein